VIYRIKYWRLGGHESTVEPDRRYGKIMAMTPSPARKLALAALAVVLASPGELAAAGHAHSHGSGAHAHRHAHGSAFAAGRPGKPEQARRTIRIEARDTMRFEPSTLNIKRGETVRLVFVNTGQLPHEAVIGSTAEQQAHEVEMQKMRDTGGTMQHHHPNAISLVPGGTGELVWRFGKPGRFEIGCHLPGHYAAGMVGKITVR
jgi:uncharacterized cupredoxin-like copper-binding protein